MSQISHRPAHRFTYIWINLEAATICGAKGDKVVISMMQENAVLMIQSGFHDLAIA